MVGRSIMEQKDAVRIARIMRLIGWFVVPAKRGGKKVNLWQKIENV
jgi:hypothetical protein